MSAVVVVCCSGCHVLSPKPMKVQSQQIATELIDSDRPQIEFGKPRPIVDGIGSVVGIPDKILLWDRRVDRHKISGDTVKTLADYLEYNHLPHVKVRANQYAPIQDWKRLTKNKTVAWPWRYSLGTLSVAGEALLPGRIIGGDHYNPFTQTIHLYSDVPAIALHEAAHAKDFTRRTYQGNYAAAYLLFPIWHETLATEDAFAYLNEHGNASGIAEANRILYPAYSTYVGNALGGIVPSYATPIFYAAVLAGHVNGRMLSRNLRSTPRFESTPLRDGAPIRKAVAETQLDSDANLAVETEHEAATVSYEELLTGFGE